MKMGLGLKYKKARQKTIGHVFHAMGVGGSASQTKGDVEFLAVSTLHNQIPQHGERPYSVSGLDCKI